MHNLSLVLLFSLLYSVHAQVKCMQCNSHVKGEVHCSDNDKLNSFSKVCTVRDEGSFKGIEAIGCRKILQTVGDDTDVIRECAYSGENVDGQRKTGTSGITMFYYQCTNEEAGTPCNSSSVVSLLIPAAILAFFSRFLC